jgi:hypothetical protein
MAPLQLRGGLAFDPTCKSVRRLEESAAIARHRGAAIVSVTALERAAVRRSQIAGFGTPRRMTREPVVDRRRITSALGVRRAGR